MTVKYGKFIRKNRMNKINKSEKTTLISPDVTGALTGRAGAGPDRKENGRKGSFLYGK